MQVLKELTSIWQTHSVCLLMRYTVHTFDLLLAKRSQTRINTWKINRLQVNWVFKQNVTMFVYVSRYFDAFMFEVARIWFWFRLRLNFFFFSAFIVVAYIIHFTFFTKVKIIIWRHLPHQQWKVSPEFAVSSAK